MNSRSVFDMQKWSVDNFEGCDLGDARRSRRLVKFAGQVANRPSASLPKIGENWGGVKGIYRLLDRPEATLSSVTEAHRRHVARAKGRWLIISDTTHVDFGKQRQIKGAGPIGRGKSKGFLLHSALQFDARTRVLSGVAGQVTHVRRQKRGKQNDSQRLKRWRESEMWIELFEQVGTPPEGSEHIHVCDSAADNFEAFCTLKRLHAGFVIRVGRYQRNVVAPDGRQMQLSQYVRELEELGEYDLEVARGNGRKARTARLRVSAGPVRIPLPEHRSRRVKAWGRPIDLWVVVVEETSPPRGVEPIRWILLTTLAADTFAAVWEIVGYYEDRWLVEEWHKALKTGCALESRQLQSVGRLLPLTGVLSVVAVLLVQLKMIAHNAPQTPASDVIPAVWIDMLQAKGKLGTKQPTVRDLWRGVAKLGGFLGRKSDGEPGWQTIWRGWLELHQLVEGARLLKKTHRRCG